MHTYSHLQHVQAAMQRERKKRIRYNPRREEKPITQISQFKLPPIPATSTGGSPEENVFGFPSYSYPPSLLGPSLFPFPSFIQSNPSIHDSILSKKGRTEVISSKIPFHTTAHDAHASHMENNTCTRVHVFFFGIKLTDTLIRCPTLYLLPFLLRERKRKEKPETDLYILRYLK